MRGRGRSHASRCLSVRDQKPCCASHFRPCWQTCRHKEDHEVAGVTMFMPEREALHPSRGLPSQSCLSFSSLPRGDGALAPLPARQRRVTPGSERGVPLAWSWGPYAAVPTAYMVPCRKQARIRPTRRRAIATMARCLPRVAARRSNISWSTGSRGTARQAISTST
jgi:hypothetical protein